MLRMSLSSLRERAEQSSTILLASAFALTGVMPILLSGQADAATLISRKVTLGSSKVSASTTHTFEFNIATAGNLGSMQFEYCTTPLGTCTAPTGMDATGVVLTTDTIGDPAVDQGFVLGTAGNAPTASVIKIEDSTPNPVLANDKVVVAFSTLVNPSTVNTAFYPRITLYSDSAYTTVTDNGAVAGSTAAQLTVNGRVQERLEFCVAAIGDVVALPTNCAAAPTATTIDIGVIDNTTTPVPKAPVDTTATNGSNDSYGMAQVNTNASSGVVVAYFPEAATTGTEELRSFRVPGAACTLGGASLTDQCFVNADAAGEAFVAGTERFGLNIPCIAASASGIGTTSNLGSVPAAYSNTDATTTDTADCENTDTGRKFAWNNSATAATLAQSSTVVDDEIIKLSFGATASATTPTGSYTVATTYIATPTF